MRPLSLQALSSEDSDKLRLSDDLDVLVLSKSEEVVIRSHDQIGLCRDGGLKYPVVVRIPNNLEADMGIYSIRDSPNFEKEAFRFSELPLVSRLQATRVKHSLQFVEQVPRYGDLKIAARRSCQEVV